MNETFRGEKDAVISGGGAKPISNLI